MYYTAAWKQLPIQSPIMRALLCQYVFLAICLKVKTINMQVYCSQLCLRLSSWLPGGTREKAHWANRALGIPLSSLHGYSLPGVFLSPSNPVCCANIHFQRSCPMWHLGMPLRCKLSWTRWLSHRTCAGQPGERGKN